MAQEVNCKVVKFDGTNYSYWKESMKYHLESLLARIQDIIKTRYTNLTNGPQNLNEVKAHENNAKDRVEIIHFLSDSIFSKVMRLKYAKQIWEKLSSVYEDDLKTKKTKLTYLKHKFENLRMSDDENIEIYLHQVNDMVSAIMGIGGKLEGSDDTTTELKKYAIEESCDMEKYTLDKLYGSLSTSEIVELDDLQKVKNESTFKVKNNIEDEPKTRNGMDEVEAKFMRRLCFCGENVEFH